MAATCAAAIAGAPSIRSPRDLKANVIAFGHTADDFCESFLRNAMFTGRISALAADHMVARQGVPADPSASLCHRRDHDAIRGVNRRAGDSLRLLATRGHGAQVDSQHVRRYREGLSASQGDAASRRWGTSSRKRLLDTRYLKLDEPAVDLLPILRD